MTEAIPNSAADRILVPVWAVRHLIQWVRIDTSTVRSREAASELQAALSNYDRQEYVE